MSKYKVIDENTIEYMGKEFSKTYIIDEFINKNVSAVDLSTDLGVTVSILSHILSLFSIKKDRELQRENARKTCVNKYGVDNIIKSKRLERSIECMVLDIIEYAIVVPRHGSTL